MFLQFDETRLDVRRTTHFLKFKARFCCKGLISNTLEVSLRNMPLDGANAQVQLHGIFLFPLPVRLGEGHVQSRIRNERQSDGPFNG
jgi:hypothetical protein